MNVDMAVEQTQNALLTAVALTAPVLLVVFVVSLVISVMQALTQIQDQINLVPRLLAGAAAVLLLLPWMLDRLTQYVTQVYGNVG